MSAAGPTHPDSLRLLVLAPTGRDAANTLSVLARGRMSAQICHNVEALCDEIEAGAGAVLITEEALVSDAPNRLHAIVTRQPPWSDLPFIVLTRGGPDSPVALRAMETLGNVILLERPVRMSTCIAAGRTALRARARQYQSRALLADLQESDRRKDEFLAMLAHELRNPLAPIRSAADILGVTTPDEERLERIAEILNRQVGNLTRLVDDLLDISRVTRGKIQLAKQRVTLATLINRAVEQSQPLIDESQHRLAVSVPEQPVYLDCDPTRIVQVLSNLLNNAAKYTPARGHIWLAAEVAGEDVAIRVRDDGIGIAPDMLSRIFDLFMQVDTSLDRARGGLGVGLTLVRSIVELHDGSVEADSEGTGRGSEFTIRLPRATAIPSDQPKQAAEVVRPRTPTRVLIVDDNADAMLSLAMLLRESGHEVRTAGNGQTALAVVESFQPEAIILDIGLPGMNGWEVARRIRAAQRSHRPLVLALTGYGHERDRLRAREAGFDEYLIKPADIGTLESLIAGHQQPIPVDPPPQAAAV
ncbi:MAG TPA: ATP-binding protein [Nevskiaceae bacterium]|nr:ATP-binding protein [Nevskiaceae bacterium]